MFTLQSRHFQFFWYAGCYKLQSSYLIVKTRSLNVHTVTDVCKYVICLCQIRYQIYGVAKALYDIFILSKFQKSGIIIFDITIPSAVPPLAFHL